MGARQDGVSTVWIARQWCAVPNGGEKGTSLILCVQSMSISVMYAFLHQESPDQQGEAVAFTLGHDVAADVGEAVEALLDVLHADGVREQRGSEQVTSPRGRRPRARRV